MATPESVAALYSMPVATSGCWVTIRGTAWRCMLAPIRARLQSSFSRKGIMAVATETHHPGRNVHKIHLFGVDLQDVVPAAGGHAGPDEMAVLVQGLVGLGHHVFVFHVGGHIDHPRR